MSLENRIEVLERELTSLKRRNRAIGVFALFAISVPALLAFTNSQEKVIRAERFEVVRGGKTVAALVADSDGGRLDIYNKDEKFVASLLGYRDGGFLMIFNTEQNMVAGLSAGPNGGGFLTIYNKDEKGVAGLFAGPDGGEFSLWTPGGQVRFKAP